MKCKCIKEFNVSECEMYSVVWEIIEVGQVFDIVKRYVNEGFYVLDDLKGNKIQVDNEQFKKYFIEI